MNVPPPLPGAQLDPNHPVSNLLFYIEGDFGADAVEDVRRLTETLALSRPWVLGAPEFVDEMDEASMTIVDEPARTVGCLLRIYSALPPWGERLPQNVDRIHLEEVRVVVSAIEAASGELAVDFGVELDNDQIGWIENGTSDEGLRRGLLDEWETHLRQSEARAHRDAP